MVKVAHHEEGRKPNRINQSKQIQKQKRNEVLSKKRLGSSRGAPKIVAIIPFSPTADTNAVAQLLAGSQLSSPPCSNSRMRCLTNTEDAKPVRITAYEAPRELIPIMDICKVADVTLLLIAPDTAGEAVSADEFSQHMLTVLKAQGLGSVIGIIQGTNKVAPKKQQAYKKIATQLMQKLFEEKPKCITLDEAKDVTALYRWMGNMKIAPVRWRDSRDYLLAESFTFASNPATKGQTGTLEIHGHLRGEHGISADQLVHITGYGDFQLSMVTARTGLQQNKGDKNAMSMDSKDTGVLVSKAQPETQESLESLRPIDPLTQERFVSNEELKLAESKRKGKGGGDYQAAWDDAAGSGDEDEEEGDEDEEDGMMDTETDRKLASKSSKSKNHGKEFKRNANANNGMMEGTDGDDGLAGLETASTMDETEERDQATKLDWDKRREMEKNEMEWPDEVEITRETRASERFQKYRGLKSFRHSKWDPKQNLPIEYSQIVEFQDFDLTARAVTNQERPIPGNGAEQVILTLHNFPSHLAQPICTGQNPIVVWPLFQYERKVSVLHFVLRRHHEEDKLPVRGKDPMTIHCGFRRFPGRPVYSQHNINANKHMVERYLQLQRHSVASVFGRVMFGPAPVLIFRDESVPNLKNPKLTTLETLPDAFKPKTETKEGVGMSDDIKMKSSLSSGPKINPLIASGNLQSVDPDRLMIKRTVLTGYPIQVNHRAAVVRYMFFNPDDIRYFKPVELWTKYGLTGHIKEPRGTKGYMKCIFDGLIKNNDTVCMSLYKRQYPPFDEAQFNGPI